LGYAFSQTSKRSFTSGKSFVNSVRLVDFSSRKVYTKKSKISMDKQELKEKIREAVEQSAFRDDIQRVSLFGSYAYGDPSEDSDVDLLIEFTPTARFGMFKYASIHNYFEDRLHKKVDIATPTALSKYIRKEVLENAEFVYKKAV
jgi:hypothetical protein